MLLDGFALQTWRARPNHRTLQNWEEERPGYEMNINKAKVTSDLDGILTNFEEGFLSSVLTSIDMYGPPGTHVDINA